MEQKKRNGRRYTVESPNRYGIWDSECVGRLCTFDSKALAIGCANDHLSEYGGKVRIVDDHGSEVWEAEKGRIEK